MMMKMKKVLLAIVMMLCVGCNANSKDKYISCKMMNYYNIMQIESNVKIYYEGTEALRSETTEYINFYETEDMTEEEMTEFIEEIVKNYDKQKKEIEAEDGMTFGYTVDESTITAHSTVDYTKVDVDIVLEQFPEVEDLVHDGKFDIAKLRETYQDLGYTCTDIK